MTSSLHLLNSWLELSETFIWHSLSNLKKYPPLILASQIKNLDEFPLKNGEILDCQPNKSRWKKLLGRVKNDFYPDDYSKCMDIISSKKISVIHAHYGYRALVASDLIRDLKKPLIANFYGYDVSHKAFLKRTQKGYQKLFQAGDRFLVEGPVMKSKLMEIGCSDEKISIHPISIPVEKYPWRIRQFDPKRSVKFLFVGRFVEKKGLLNGLKALDSIKDQVNWELTMVGDGPLRPILESYIKTKGLGSQVKIMGYVLPSLLAEVLDGHDVLIQPSMTAEDGDCEGGAPTVILEAQACGMPVLSSYHCDIPYILEDGVSGLLAEENDVTSLAKNILKLCNEPERWKGMSKAGRKYVMENHNSPVLSESLEKIYNEVLGEV